jgi:hypothetical protein
VAFGLVYLTLARVLSWLVLLVEFQKSGMVADASGD